ncbi:MAG: nitrous oxide reductase accessory protein NosL [Planctomycetes bacterium]|nr:nitrous oxide reductase accessory protein NosL [Planctomycetota bacterium]
MKSQTPAQPAIGRWTTVSARIAFALIALCAFAGCNRGRDASPPKIAYGEAECHLCKMIISEERFAAAAVVDDNGHIRKLAFDDIGCLLDFVAASPDAPPIACYVHDHEALGWLDTAKAVFIHSESLQTPMASHLAACRAQSDAEVLLRRFPGATKKFSELLKQTGEKPAVDAAASERKTP